MQLLSLFVLICGLLAVAYAETQTQDVEAGPSTVILHRNKRGLLLAKKAALVGGVLLAKKAIIAKKALLIGGVGLVGAGLGTALYKTKSGYGQGGYGGYQGGYGGGHQGGYGGEHQVGYGGGYPNGYGGGYQNGYGGGYQGAYGAGSNRW